MMASCGCLNIDLQAGSLWTSDVSLCAFTRFLLCGTKGSNENDKEAELEAIHFRSPIF